MEDIISSSDKILDIDSTEEILLGEPERNYVTVLRRAHNLLLPNKRFAYDLVNECNMIKVAIKDLVRSQRSEAGKYAILLQLAAEVGLVVDPRFSLWEIGASIQDYYMNTCLAIPGVQNQLAILWGLGVRQQVKDYSAYCDSISQKVNQVFGEDFETPRHVVSMLFDPEVGLLGGLEMRLNQNIELTEEDQAKWYANHIIIWKVTDPDGFRGVYDNYSRGLQAFTNLNLGDYVSGETPIVSEDEANLFRNYHKVNNAGTAPYSFTAADVTNHLNAGPHNSHKITSGEANFIMIVRDRFLSGEYPIDMLWKDVCR